MILASSSAGRSPSRCNFKPLVRIRSTLCFVWQNQAHGVHEERLHFPNLVCGNDLGACGPHSHHMGQLEILSVLPLDLVEEELGSWSEHSNRVAVLLGQFKIVHPLIRTEICVVKIDLMSTLHAHPDTLVAPRVGISQETKVDFPIGVQIGKVVCRTDECPNCWSRFLCSTCTSTYSSTCF